MPLTSASTVADIKAAYMDNMGYEAAASVAMAQAFLAACMALSLVMPVSHGQDRSSSAFNVAGIEKQIERVRLWLALNPGTAGGGTGRYIATDFLRGPGAGDTVITVDPTDQGGG